MNDNNKMSQIMAVSNQRNNVMIRKTQKRKLSVEILRILSMLMILGLHANFNGIGVPKGSDVITWDGIIRIALQSIFIVAVNVFVMISGWFGIRPSMKGFCKFIWQVFFCVSILQIIGYLWLDKPSTIKSIFWCLGLYGGGGWFVSSYLGLYLIAPILNSFIANSTTKQIGITLLSFFCFQFFWGNTQSAPFIAYGYSTFSFIGLYVLAGFLRKLNLSYSMGIYWLTWAFVTTLNALMYLIADKYDITGLQTVLYNYINPLVIISASSLLMAFAHSNIKAVAKNGGGNFLHVLQVAIYRVADSCFAVYLFHVGTNYIFVEYCNTAKQIYENTNGIMSLMYEIGYILCIFIIAVLLDQPRKLIWNKILSPFFLNREAI